MKYLIPALILFVGIITFYYNNYKQPKKTSTKLKEALLLQFKMNQTLSINLKKDLEEYASKTSSLDKDIFSGITFRQYIIELQKSQKTNLSEDLYSEIETTNYDNDLYLQSMYDSLKTQYHNLELIKNETTIKLDNL
ncbi:hypothetical protein [Tenacibaculum halocynthiae]|uniref:hypothetical protein n=1 Tax=Tenacibaculum halocynthiae TaxID=1254437 RepID=UPI003D661FEA